VLLIDCKDEGREPRANPYTTLVFKNILLHYFEKINFYFPEEGLCIPLKFHFSQNIALIKVQFSEWELYSQGSLMCQGLWQSLQQI